MSHHTVPKWALQRVSAVMEARKANDRPDISATEVARHSGMNKRLVRQCLYVLQHQRAARSEPAG